MEYIITVLVFGKTLILPGSQEIKAWCDAVDNPRSLCLPFTLIGALAKPGLSSAKRSGLFTYVHRQDAGKFVQGFMPPGPRFRYYPEIE